MLDSISRKKDHPLFSLSLTYKHIHTQSDRQLKYGSGQGTVFQCCPYKGQSSVLLCSSDTHWPLIAVTLKRPSFSRKLGYPLLQLPRLSHVGQKKTDVCQHIIRSLNKHDGGPLVWEGTSAILENSNDSSEEEESFVCVRLYAMHPNTLPSSPTSLSPGL